MSTNVNTSINLSDESYYNSQHQHGTHTQIQQVAQSVLALQKEEGRAEKNINVMYGKEDLSSSALFCGKEKGFKTARAGRAG